MFEREYAFVNRSSIAHHSDLEDIHALNYSRGSNVRVGTRQCFRAHDYLGRSWRNNTTQYHSDR